MHLKSSKISQMPFLYSALSLSQINEFCASKIELRLTIKALILYKIDISVVQFYTDKLLFFLL